MLTSAWLMIWFGFTLCLWPMFFLWAIGPKGGLCRSMQNLTWVSWACRTWQQISFQNPVMIPNSSEIHSFHHSLGFAKRAHRVIDSRAFFSKSLLLDRVQVARTMAYGFVLVHWHGHEQYLEGIPHHAMNPTWDHWWSTPRFTTLRSSYLRSYKEWQGALSLDNPIWNMDASRHEEWSRCIFMYFSVQAGKHMQTSLANMWPLWILLLQGEATRPIPGARQKNQKKTTWKDRTDRVPSHWQALKLSGMFDSWCHFSPNFYIAVRNSSRLDFDL